MFGQDAQAVAAACLRLPPAKANDDLLMES
jgi:hypothetical protein